MTGIMVLGHGHFASGIASAAELILGKQDDFVWVDFPEGDTKTDLWKARWLWDTGTGDWILYKNGLQSLSLLFLRLFALVFL